MDKNISFTLKVWRQKGPKAKGAFETYQMKDIPGDTSFLEMLDILNEQLISEGKEPVVFDHDCREGICGMCSLYINALLVYLPFALLTYMDSLSTYKALSLRYQLTRMSR